MKRPKIRRIIKEKVTNIRELGEKVNDGFDKDDIHDFRVEIKILRSFLRLLNAYDPHKKLKLTKKAKRLYQITGAIRDTQLELERILQAGLDLPAYVHKLHQQINESQNEWHKIYSPKIFRKLEGRLTKINNEPLTVSAFDNFRLACIGEIDQLGKTRPATDSNIHEVRKKAKDILYVSKVARKKWDKAAEHVREQELKLLDGLSDTIGEYNDGVVHLDHLKRFSTAKKPAYEKKVAAAICNRESKRLDEEKTKVTQEIEASLRKLEAPL